jgi:hypothetical protein
MQPSTVIYHCPHCQAELQEHWVENGGIVQCRNPECLQRSVLDLPKAEVEVPADTAEVARFPTPLFRRHPLRLLGLTALMLLGGLLFVYSWHFDSWLLFNVGLAGVLIGGLMLLTWYVRASASWLSVTPQALIFHDGERVCEVSHAHVTEVAIYRGLLARLLGTGSIQFTWGETNRVNTVAVANPRAVVDLVRKYRDSGVHSTAPTQA